MRPELTGRGEGFAFFNAGLDFARRRYRPQRFQLDVAAFNLRAQRVYMRAGFIPVRTFRRRTRAGWMEHIEMQRDA
jgi:ribosomal-protein-alanine N-acetyltransferase